MYIRWSEEQAATLDKANVPVDFRADMDDDDLDALYEIVPDHLQQSGFSDLWEDILTAVAVAMEERHLLSGQEPLR